jgi:adenosylhomocysteine nucleosidase
MPRVAIIAAMEREIAPLARDFVKSGERLYERGDVRLMRSGMGAAHAAKAAQWLTAEFKPELLISAGFAGGLKAQHRPGEVLVCGKVIDEQSGEIFSGAAGESILVTCGGVLSGEDKRRLAAQHDADAVDMEAAAVARVAHEKGIAFAAVKAISDEMDFEMPPMERFIDENGDFETSKLVAYAAVRPGMWPILARLEKNTKLASDRLCNWLEDQMKSHFELLLAHAKI